jgi:hypothetical protein
VLKRGGLFLFNVWDSLDANPAPRAAHQAVARLFPDDPPTFLERVPFGYFDKARIENDLAAAGFEEAVIETVAKRSRAADPREVATGFARDRRCAPRSKRAMLRALAKRPRPPPPRSRHWRGTTGSTSDVGPCRDGAELTPGSAALGLRPSPGDEAPCTRARRGGTARRCGVGIGQLPKLKAFLSGGGEMSERIRAHDWDATPFGPIHDWPQSLRSGLGIALRSTVASAVFWGPDHLFLYNDRWAGLLRDGRHPWALGRRASEVLADVWEVLAEQFGRVLAEGEAVNMVDTLLVRNLGGQVYDSYWSYSLLPVAGEDGRIAGILAQVRESTQYVQRGRRDALMLRIAERLRLGSDPDEILHGALDLIGEEVDASRIGYAEIDEDTGTVAILGCAVRTAPRTSAAPSRCPISARRSTRTCGSAGRSGSRTPPPIRALRLRT